MGKINDRHDAIADALVECLVDLQAVNVPPNNNRETSLAITKLEECLFWLHASIEMGAGRARSVEGTSAP